MVAWPSRSLTTLTGAPSLIRRLPWVWRTSWSRMTGTPARRAMRFERLREGVGIDGFAVTVSEHPAVAVSKADGGELGALEGSPASKHVEGGRSRSIVRRDVRVLPRVFSSRSLGARNEFSARWLTQMSGSTPRLGGQRSGAWCLSVRAGVDRADHRARATPSRVRVATGSGPGGGTLDGKAGHQNQGADGAVERRDDGGEEQELGIDHGEDGTDRRWRRRHLKVDTWVASPRSLECNARRA